MTSLPTSGPGSGTPANVHTDPRMHARVLQFSREKYFKQQFLHFDFLQMCRLVLEASESDVTSRTPSQPKPSEAQFPMRRGVEANCFASLPQFPVSRVEVIAGPSRRCLENTTNPQLWAPHMAGAWCGSLSDYVMRVGHRGSELSQNP